MGTKYKIPGGSWLYLRSDEKRYTQRVAKLLKNKPHGTTVTELSEEYKKAYGKGGHKIQISRAVYLLLLKRFIKIRQFGRTRVIYLTPKGKNL